MTKTFFNSQIIGGAYVEDGSSSGDGLPPGSSYTPCCTSNSNIYDWEKQLALSNYSGTSAGSSDEFASAMYYTTYEAAYSCSTCEEGAPDTYMTKYYDPRNFTTMLYGEDSYVFEGTIIYSFTGANVVDFLFDASAVFLTPKYNIHEFSATCTFPTSSTSELTSISDVSNDVTLNAAGVTFKRCKRNYIAPVSGVITVRFKGCYHSKVKIFRGIYLLSYFKCLNVGAYTPEIIDFRFSDGDPNTIDADMCMCRSENIDIVMYTSSRYAVNKGTIIVHKFKWNDAYPDDRDKMIPEVRCTVFESNYDPDPVNNPRYNPYAYTPIPSLEFGTYTMELYMQNSVGTSDSIFLGFVDKVEDGAKFEVTPKLDYTLTVPHPNIKVREPYSVLFDLLKVDSEAAWDVELYSSIYEFKGSTGNHFASYSVGENHQVFMNDFPSKVKFNYKMHGPAGLVLPGPYVGTYTYIERCGYTKNHSINMSVSFPSPRVDFTYKTKDFPSGITQVTYSVPAYADAVEYYYTPAEYNLDESVKEIEKFYHVHYTNTFDLDYGNGTIVTKNVTDEFNLDLTPLKVNYQPGNYFATYTAHNPTEVSENTQELNLDWDEPFPPGYWILSYPANDDITLKIDPDMHHSVASFAFDLPDNTHYEYTEVYQDNWSRFATNEFATMDTFATFYYSNPKYYRENTCDIQDWRIYTDRINVLSVTNGPIDHFPSFTVFGSHFIGITEGYIFPTFNQPNLPFTDAKGSDVFPTLTNVARFTVDVISDNEILCQFPSPIPEYWLASCNKWDPETETYDYGDSLYNKTAGNTYWVHIADKNRKAMNHVLTVDVDDNIPYITGFHSPHYIMRGKDEFATIYVKGRFKDITDVKVKDVKKGDINVGAYSFPTVLGNESVKDGSVMKLDVATKSDTPIGRLNVEVYNSFGSADSSHLTNRSWENSVIVDYNPVITSAVPSTLEIGILRHLTWNADDTKNNQIAIWGQDLFPSANILINADQSGLLFSFPTYDINDGSHVHMNLDTTITRNWDGSIIPVKLRGMVDGRSESPLIGNYSVLPVLTLVPPEKVEITDLSSSAELLLPDATIYSGKYNEIVTITLIGSGFKLYEEIDNVKRYITVGLDAYEIWTDGVPYDPLKHLSVSGGSISFKVWINPGINKCTPVTFTVVNPDGAYTSYTYRSNFHMFMVGQVKATLSALSISGHGGPKTFAAATLSGNNIATFENITCMKISYGASRGAKWKPVSVISATVTHGLPGTVSAVMQIKFISIIPNNNSISIKTSHCNIESDSLISA